MKKFPSLFIVVLCLVFYYSYSDIQSYCTKNKGDIEQTTNQIWQAQFDRKKEKRKKAYSKADKPDFFTKHYKAITTKISDSESKYEHNYKQNELKKNNSPRLKSASQALQFTSVGPYNVGGRTRAILIDPDDDTKQTWYTGAATGGVWFTVNAGDLWNVLSNDMTNLSVNALAMSKSNPDIMYAGTGESFPGGSSSRGNGIWKSENRGKSWFQLNSTATDESFSFTNRLWIDPSNSEILLAATNTGIYKSTDGGFSWQTTYSSVTRVEDFAFHKQSVDTLYASVNSLGVVRSADGGSSWSLFSAGLPRAKRIEISVSQVNRKYIYASIDEHDEKSSLYVSQDKALTWVEFDSDENFLGGQGGYDNCIVGHPYDENIVFLGGVNLWKVNLHNTISYENKVLGVENVNVNFMSFTSFGAKYYEGKLSVSGGTMLEDSDWSSVEIRFGPDIKQKAHRFTVPKESTSGVDEIDFKYADYVDVPFQVWDTKNERQLMVSFRDQEGDGLFNLYTTTGKDYGQLGREYIFINAVAYDSENPNEEIEKNGGHKYKNLYMLWPQLEEGFIWDDTNLHESKIIINYGGSPLLKGTQSCIADAYGNISGLNSYDQGAGFGKHIIPGLHPDHHNITIIPLGDNNFTIVNGNDGGIGVSYDKGVSFKQKTNGYVTTQFYGVAKNPNKNQYIGGMQDNGTWMSSDNIEEDKRFTFQLGGDGFECLWHAQDENKLLGSVYYNAIKRSINGGVSWSSVRGIEKEDGPFITRLSSSVKHPDVVFAVAKNGIYKSSDFGANWILKHEGALWDYASSEHNIAVSVADPNYVWAGQQMSAFSGTNIFVSKDEGETFSAIQNYDIVDIDARLSAIATHPRDKDIAYLLFSTAKSPKILRTTDCGNTWHDISGFDNNNESKNGFPDVVINSLLVMPYNTDIIWVGTEIGIYESINNGVSWHKLNANLPSVSVYQLKIQANQIIIATHGRGIWTYDTDLNPEIANLSEAKIYEVSLDAVLKFTCDSLDVIINDELSKRLYNLEPGVQNIVFNLDFAGSKNIQLISYVNGFSYSSSIHNLNIENKSPELVTIDETKHLNFSLDIKMNYNYDSLYILVDNVIMKKHIKITSSNLKSNFQVDNIGNKDIRFKAFLPNLILNSIQYQFNIIDKQPVINSVYMLDKELLKVECFLDFTYDKLEIYVDDKPMNTIHDPSPGDNVYQINNVNPASHRVKIIAYSGKFIFPSQEHTSSVLTSIENKYDKGISVFPNPCSDYVNIQLDAKYSEFYISVIDMKGVSLMLRKCVNTDINRINLTHINSGIYIIKIKTIDKIFVEKIKIL